MIRLLQVLLVLLLAAFALIAGLLVAAVVAVAGIGYFLFQLFGGRRAPSLSGPPAAGHGVPAADRSDVIEVSAIEIAENLPKITAPSEGNEATQPPDRPAPPGHP